MGKPERVFEVEVGAGGVSWSKLKFEKIPLVLVSGGWEQPGAWGLVGDYPLPAQINR